MIPDDSVAYALATWKRFDERVPDGLLRAVAGAFVMVAAADGEMSPPEAERFLEVIQSKADVFAPIDFVELQAIFSDLAEAMLADPNDGKRLALKAVGRVRGVPAHAKLVEHAAQIAADADGRLVSVEASVMQEIRRALGLQAP
jgi:tellurite resistance protein